MNMTAEKQIEAYCKENADVWHPAGRLQRMEWKNEDGTTAIPKSISRRLQELENKRVLAVRHTGAKNTAEYRYVPGGDRSRYNTLQEREEKSLPMWKPLALASTPEHKPQAVAPPKKTDPMKTFYEEKDYPMTETEQKEAEETRKRVSEALKGRWGAQAKV